MFEVFNPRDGAPLYRVPFAWLARLIVRCCRHRHGGGLDWARPGEGWPLE